MKQLARVTALIVFTLGLVALVWIFSSAVLLFTLSLVVAGAVRPLALRLMQRGMGRSTAYGTVFVAVLVVLGALLVAVVPQLLNELQYVTNDLLRFYDKVLVSWPHGAEWQQTVVQELPSHTVLLDSIAGEQGSGIATTVIGFGSSLFDVLAQLVVAISLSVYWATDQLHFERLWLSLVSPRLRPRARTIWRLVETEMGAYIRSELIQSVLAGIFLGLMYRFIGLPYPALLALWAGVVWLIPWVGVILALVPAALVGWAVSPLATGLAVVATISVFAFMQIWVEPRLYGRTRISPILVLLVLMVMAQYAGILGMLLAPPVAAAIQILGRQLLFKPAVRQVNPELMAQIVDLRSRLATVRLAAQGDQELDSHQALNLFQRVEELIDKSHAMLDTSGMLVEIKEEPAAPSQPAPQAG